MSKQVAEASGDYEAEKQEQQVKKFLKEQKSQKIVDDAKKLVTDIEANNIKTQQQNEAEA